VTPERAERLISRLAPKGYDRAKRTFRPWWRLGRYAVELRQGKGVPHTMGARIVVGYESGACPHALVHAFFHEVGHVQMLMLDVGVFSVVGPLAFAYAWWAALVAFVAWTLIWREMTAEVYVTAKLGVRNVIKGYTHLGRSIGAGRGT
jgi:hypothetical protein